MNPILIASQIAVVITILVMVQSQQVEAGGNKGNKGERDIILYKNNLLIRDNDKKGKGKGGGTLLIAADQHKHGHHEMGHEMGHYGDYYGGHHGAGFEQKLIAEVIMNNDNKGKGKGRGRNNNNNNNGQKKNNQMGWENILMGGGGSGHGFRR